MPHTTETLPGGTVVFTSAAHRFGTDSLLLASFCKPRPRWTVCDLGSGGGILLLSLADRGLQGESTGVELDPAGSLLLKSSAAHNNLPNIHAHTGDFRNFSTPRPFDMVVANPPYFNTGALPANSRRAAARHEENGSIADLCHTAGRILKDKGRLLLCYPPTRMADLFAALNAANLAPKRMQMVRKTPETDPWLLLLDARKSAGVGLRILPELLLPAGTPLQY